MATAKTYIYNKYYGKSNSSAYTSSNQRVIMMGNTFSSFHALR